jgi:hypothetical protein
VKLLPKKHDSSDTCLTACMLPLLPLLLLLLLFGV